MEYTEKLHLNLPSETDPLEIEKLNENFRKIDGHLAETGEAHKVGDILPTWRTDLGEDWLLCNGEAFEPAEYPALAAITPGMISMTELCQSGVIADGASTSINPGAVGYATDGVKEVVLTGAGYLLVSSDGFASVNAIKGPNGGPYGRIFYVNGQWIITKSSQTDISAFYLANDPEGSWTEVALSKTSISVRHLEYFNGRYWVFGTYDSSNKPRYGSFADFEISSIVVNKITAADKETGASFVRADKFVFVCAASASNIYFISTDDPTGEWEKSDSVALPAPPTGRISKTTNNFAWQDGKFLGAAYINTSTGTTASYSCFAGLVIEDGEARLLSPAELSAKLSSINEDYGAPLIVRGAYLFGGYSSLISAADDTGNVTVAPVDASIQSYTCAVVSHGRALFFSASEDKKSVIMSSVPVYGVPAIAPPQSHAFIKAK